MIFKYKAVDPNNNKKEGTIDAVSLEVAISSLQKRGLILSSIDAEEAGLIMEAEQARDEKQFALLDKKMTELNDLQTTKIQAIKDQQQMAIQQEQLLLQKAQNLREQQRFDREEEEAVIADVIGSLYSSLGDDETFNQETILDAAEQYGIDPNKLIGKLNEYGQQEELRLIDIADAYNNIAKDIPAGEVRVDPYTGLTIYGTEDPETIDIEEVIGNQAFKVRYKIDENGNPVKQFSIPLGQKYKSSGGGGGGSSSTDSSYLSGTYPENYILQEMDNYRFEDGSLDWEALSDLNKANPALANDIKLAYIQEINQPFDKTFDSTQVEIGSYTANELGEEYRDLVLKQPGSIGFILDNQKKFEEAGGYEKVGDFFKGVLGIK
jgi:hypothetical protein